MKKNIIALILSTLMLSSCNATTNNTTTSNTTTNTSNISETAMGRYIEEDVDFPSIEIIKFMKTDECFEVFGKSDGQLQWYKSNDGLTWNKQEAAWIDELNKEDYWIRDISYSKDKNIYISIMGDNAVVKSVEDGNTLKDVNINWRNDFTYINSTYVLDNGDFLIVNVSDGAERYDKDGNFIMDYPFEIYYDTAPSALFENKLALEDNKENAIKIYNIDTGEVENNLSYKGLWDTGSHLTFGKDGSLYIQNNLGISRVTPGGSKFEEIVDGSMTSFNMPSMRCCQLLEYNNEFWAAFYNNQIKHYVYSENTPSKPNQEVVIYMLNENDAMRQLAGEYQKNHPEIKVTCNVAMDSETVATKSDTIRILNTQLLNGKGPDLILLDDLPINSYIEKGVLMDLSDIDISQLNNTIANTYKQNDKLYAVPLYYKIPMMYASNDIIDNVKNLDDLVNWKNTHTDRNLFKSANYSDLIKAFYLTSAPYWLENDEIDKNKFKKFLEDIKNLETIDEETENLVKVNLAVAENSSMANSIEPLMLQGKNNVVNFAYNDFDLYIDKIDSFFSIMMPIAATVKRENSSFASCVGQAKNVYEPSTILAINANSQNKDIAKEIMKLAVSEKIQNTKLYGLGICVNNNSLEKALTLTDYGSESSSYRDTNRHLDASWPESKYIENFKEVIKNLDTPCQLNETLIQIILDETKGYFENTKTLDEAVEAVSQRTKAYFAE